LGEKRKGKGVEVGRLLNNHRTLQQTLQTSSTILSEVEARRATKEILIAVPGSIFGQAPDRFCSKTSLEVCDG
jgi:hypothetical protein